MTLNQIRYVVTIAKAGKMSLAADELFITQPTLSGEVKKLEDELQIQIFERHRNGVLITPEGAELVAYMQSILDTAAYIKQKYQNHQAEKQRFAVAGHHSSFISSAFIDLMKMHREDNYDFKILEERTTEILNHVQNGYCDIGVLLVQQSNRVLKREIDNRDLSMEVLTTETPHVYVWPTHPLASKAELTMEELLPYPFTLYEQGGDSWQYFSEEIEGELKSPRTIALSDRSTQIKLAMLTDAYTIGSGRMDRELHEANSVAIPLRSEELIDIVWIKRKGRVASPLMKEYLENLKNALQ